MSSKSSLSVGDIIRDLLMSDTRISNKITKCYPIVEDKATVPYIVYRRSGLSQDIAKAKMSGSHNSGADTIVMQVQVFAKNYKQSVTIAEDVRDILDGATSVHDCSDFGISLSSDFGTSTNSTSSLVMRECHLSDSQELWSGDAFVQNLIFIIKV